MPSTPSPSREHLLRQRTQELERALRKVKKGSASGVHKARIATRRLRELVPLLAMNHDHAGRILRRLSKGGTRLGRVRELDVQLGQLEPLVADAAPDAPLPRLQRELLDKVERRRRRLIDSKAFGQLERAIELLDTSKDSLTSSARGTRDLRWTVQARLVRRSIDLRRAMESTGAMYDPEALHRVRVAAKKLRYTLEIATDACDARYADDLRLLVRAQQILGRQHDAQVLYDTLGTILADSAGEASADAERIRAALDGRCHNLHARFLLMRPALIEACTRIGAKTGASPARQRRKAS